LALIRYLHIALQFVFEYEVEIGTAALGFSIPAAVKAVDIIGEQGDTVMAVVVKLHRAVEHGYISCIACKAAEDRFGDFYSGGGYSKQKLTL